MSSYDIVRILAERGLKHPKKPQNRQFCSALPCNVNALVAATAHTLIPATKSGESYLSKPSLFSLILALSKGIGVTGSPPSQIATQGILGAYMGIFTAERKGKLNTAFALLIGVYLIGIGFSYICFLSVSNFLDFLIFLWIRISEVTPKEFLDYSKRKTR